MASALPMLFSTLTALDHGNNSRLSRPPSGAPDGSLSVTELPGVACFSASKPNTVQLEMLPYVPHILSKEHRPANAMRARCGCHQSCSLLVPIR